jgi:hypothetical protein
MAAIPSNAFPSNSRSDKNVNALKKLDLPGTVVNPHNKPWIRFPFGPPGQPADFSIPKYLLARKPRIKRIYR